MEISDYKKFRKSFLNCIITTFSDQHINCLIFCITHLHTFKSVLLPLCPSTYMHDSHQTLHHINSHFTNSCTNMFTQMSDTFRTVTYMPTLSVTDTHWHKCVWTVISNCQTWCPCCWGLLFSRWFTHIRVFFWQPIKVLWKAIFTSVINGKYTHGFIVFSLIYLCFYYYSKVPISHVF